MGRVCSTYEGDERCIQVVGEETGVKENNLEDPDVDGDNIEIDIQEVG
jgi:hypothetical protein